MAQGGWSVSESVAEHFGDRFQLLPQGSELRFVNKSASPSDFQQRNGFLNRAAGDREKVLAIWLCKTAVTFSQIGRDRQGRAIELIRQQEVSARKLLRVSPVTSSAMVTAF